LRNVYLQFNLRLW